MKKSKKQLVTARKKTTASVSQRKKVTSLFKTILRNGVVDEDRGVIFSNFIYYPHLLCILMLVFCTNPILAQSKWEKVDNPSLNAIKTLKFINDHVGFASLTNNLLKTTDRGSSWKLCGRQDTNFTIVDFSFPNSTTGYILSSSKIIEKTTDGGTTWIDQAPNALFYGFMREVSFINKDTGFVIGNDGINYVLIRTTDGGINWTQQQIFGLMSSGYGLNHLGNNVHVSFPTDKIGYVISNDTLWKSFDGGTTWAKTKVFIPAQNATQVTRLDFRTPALGWCFESVATPNPTYHGYKTSDSGKSWKNFYNISGDDRLVSYDFLDVNQGFVVAVNNSGISGIDGIYCIYRTTNNGATWVKSAYGVSAVNDICFVDSTLCIAFGSDILKRTLTKNYSFTDTLNFISTPCLAKEEEIVIRNTGDYPIRIDSLLINGNGSANFSIENPPQFPMTLDISSSVHLAIRFEKGLSSAGEKHAFLNIYSDDRWPLADTLKKIILRGKIDSIGVESLTKNISFDSMHCDDVSRDSDVYVRNTGAVTTTIAALVDDAVSSSYSVSPLSVDVLAGGNGKFTIHCQPIGNGSFEGKVTFVTLLCNGTRQDTMHVSITKSSANTGMTNIPPLLDYGNVQCKAAYGIDSILVHNTAGVPITVGPSSLSGTPFEVVKPTTSVTLSANESTYFVIRFAPAASGVYKTNFYLNAEPCHISTLHVLRGVKDSVNFVTATKDIDFGVLNCNDDPRGSLVVIKNVGTATLSLTTMIIGDGATGYSVSPINSSILAGDSVTLTVHFGPNEAKQFVAKLVLKCMPCILSDTITLIGNKISNAAISSDMSDMDYGKVQSGTSRDTSIKIINTGSMTITVDTPKMRIGSHFSVLSPKKKFYLSAGADSLVRVRFQPSEQGLYSDTLVFHTIQCKLTLNVPLKGNDGISDVKLYTQPPTFWLGQNYPNPFTMLSVVSCQLSGNSKGIFEVRNMLGRMVQRLSIDSYTKQITVDASELPNGMYSYSLNDGKNIHSRTMMVLK